MRLNLSDYWCLLFPNKAQKSIRRKLDTNTELNQRTSTSRCEKWVGICTQTSSNSPEAKVDQHVFLETRITGIDGGPWDTFGEGKISALGCRSFCLSPMQEYLVYFQYCPASFFRLKQRVNTHEIIQRKLCQLQLPSQRAHCLVAFTDPYSALQKS